MFGANSFFARTFRAGSFPRVRAPVDGPFGTQGALGAQSFAAYTFRARSLTYGRAAAPPTTGGTDTAVPTGVWTRIGRDSQGWARIGRDSQAWTEQTPDTQVWIRAGSIGGEGGGGGYDNVWELTEVGGALNWFESN